MWIFLDHYRNRNNCLIYLISINNKESPIWQFHVGFISLTDPHTSCRIQTVLLLLRRSHKHIKISSKCQQQKTKNLFHPRRESCAGCNWIYLNREKFWFWEFSVRQIAGIVTLDCWYFVISYLISFARIHFAVWNFIFFFQQHTKKKYHNFFETRITVKSYQIDRFWFFLLSIITAYDNNDTSTKLYFFWFYGFNSITVVVDTHHKIL